MKLEFGFGMDLELASFEKSWFNLLSIRKWRHYFNANYNLAKRAKWNR